MVFLLLASFSSSIFLSVQAFAKQRRAGFLSERASIVLPHHNGSMWFLLEVAVLWDCMGYLWVKLFSH